MLVCVKSGVKPSTECPDGITRVHNVRGYYLYNSETGKVEFHHNKELEKRLDMGEKVGGLRVYRNSLGFLQVYTLPTERDAMFYYLGVDRKTLVK